MKPERSKVKSKRIAGKEQVLTPGGWRPKSKAIEVQPGHHVTVEDGKVHVIHTATGKVVGGTRKK